MSGQGFASLSQQRRKELGRKGGKSAHQKGKRYRWSAAQATGASAKGVEVRKRNLAVRAAKRLMNADFTAEDLQALTVDEFIYYGSSRKRAEELRKKIKLTTPPIGS